MDVLFIVLPFADIHHPAIGVSLLHTQLVEIGIRSAVLYTNIELAEWIGADLYAWIAEEHPLDSYMPAVSLVGEWFFADTVFDTLPQEQDYVERFLQGETSSRLRIPEILKARSVRNEFVDNCVREIQRFNPRIVGFTTSFQQTCTCLSVARRLKQRPDSPIIMFGGANCEGVMGMQLLASFPWIDYVCTGEGDLAVPLFIKDFLQESSGEIVPGILKQCGGVQGVSFPPSILNMDELPIPDYRDYFDRIRRSSLTDTIEPKLLMETSRGCWWGEKKHCTFCGLNGETMSFRSKSPASVIRELREQTEKYAITRVDTVDNILDLKYLHTLFPALIESGPRVQLFYETKANLRLDQLRLLRDGGVCCIQAGIESFSNQVLCLMHKGCTGSTNIQLLRWAEELQIQVVWNLIFGFPGECPSEYGWMAKLLPLLVHLQPPTFCVRLRMDRFSPLYMSGDNVGLVRRRPLLAYSYVLPVNNQSLENLAYFFEFEYADGREPASYASPTIQAVSQWIAEAQNGPRLDLFRVRDVALINDTRACATRKMHVLSGVAAQVCLACDTSQTAVGLARTLEVNEVRICETLEALIDAKLMVAIEDRYVSLPVIRTRDAPTSRVASDPETLVASPG